MQTDVKKWLPLKMAKCLVKAPASIRQYMECTKPELGRWLFCRSLWLFTSGKDKRLALLHQITLLQTLF